MKLLQKIDNLTMQLDNIKVTDDNYFEKLFTLKKELTSAKVEFLRKFFNSYNLKPLKQYPKNNKNNFVISIEFNKMNGTIVQRYLLIKDISNALNISKKLLRIGIKINLSYNEIHHIQLNYNCFNSQAKRVFKHWSIKKENNINNWNGNIF